VINRYEGEIFLSRKLVLLSTLFGPLSHFIGYGWLDAPLWFLGREEGLGRRPKRPSWSLTWELQVRSHWQPVMDARQAHELLQDPYWENPGGSQVWKHMAGLVRGLLHGAPDWQDPDLAWRYVVNRLGRADRETLLGEAFPLPKANVASWPYTDLFPTQKEYKAWVWPQRKAMWQNLLAKYHPRIVIAFGGWWQSRRDIFGSLDWQLLPGDRVQTARIQSGTQVYLTPFFGRGQLHPDDLQAIITHGRS
jgi:hypothetical protein